MDANWTALNTDKVETSDPAYLKTDNVKTVTNKSIALASNTITGTQAQFNTALSDGQFVMSDADTGAAVIPSGTTAQRPTGVVGKIRWNSTLNQYEGYTNAATWEAIGGGAKGGAGNPVFFENDITVSVDYTITANKNAMSAGPITVANGISVVVPNGAVWSVV
jgi:hypothetical protein